MATEGLVAEAPLLALLALLVVLLSAFLFALQKRSRSRSERHEVIAAQRRDDMRRVRERQQKEQDEASNQARSDEKAQKRRAREEQEARQRVLREDRPSATSSSNILNSNLNSASRRQEVHRPARFWGADRCRPRGG